MTKVNLWAFLLYTLGVIFYLYENKYGPFDRLQCKGFFYLITFFMLLYVMAYRWLGCGENDPYRLNVLCELAILADFIILAFSQLGLLPDSANFMIIFNGSIFALTIMIFIAASRYGLLRKS